MKLSFDEKGRGDPALLFIHGWCCDRSYFAPQFDHFGQSHRVVAVDQRGHGKTDKASDGDYSVAAFAADAAELIDELGLDRPVVVGHSLGGLVALGLAASRPEVVRGVVMVDPAPIVISPEIQGMITAVGPTLGTVEGRKAFVGGNMFAPTDDVDRKNQIVDAMSGASDDVAVAAFEGIVSFDGPAALRACATPIASIGSDGPTNDAATLKEHCPHIIVSQTLASGHFNQLEVPDQVNAMIEQFLRVAV